MVGLDTNNTVCVFQLRLMRSSWLQLDACHVALLGGETSKHEQPKPCSIAPEALALLSFVEGRFLQCALMFSIYPVNSHSSSLQQLNNDNISMESNQHVQFSMHPF